MRVTMQRMEVRDNCRKGATCSQFLFDVRCHPGQFGISVLAYTDLLDGFRSGATVDPVAPVGGFDKRSDEGKRAAVKRPAFSK